MRSTRSPSSLFNWPEHRPAQVAMRSAGLGLALLFLSIMAGMVSAMFAPPGEANGLFFGTMFTFGLATMASGVVGFVSGLVAIVRDHEHSVYVILAMAFGGVLSSFLIAEMFILHE